MSESFAVLAAQGLDGTTLGKAVTRLEEQTTPGEAPSLCIYWVVPDETDAPESEWTPERISRWWRIDLSGPPPDGSNLGLGVGLTVVELVARLRQDPHYTTQPASPQRCDLGLSRGFASP
jgi:hypothetical protein